MNAEMKAHGQRTDAPTAGQAKRIEDGSKYLQCIPASNPICPEFICPSMKKCPVKATAEPYVWGPKVWYFLHVSSMHYPKKPTLQRMQGCQNFFKGLPFMLPCGDCGRHLLQYLQRRSRDIKRACRSRTGMVKFMVQAHNHVSKRLGRRQWTVTEAYRSYSTTRVCLQNTATWNSKNPLE